MPLNRRIVLAARPVGVPKESDFRLVEGPAPEPGPGECLVQAAYMSVDPYMRGPHQRQEILRRARGARPDHGRCRCRPCGCVPHGSVRRGRLRSGRRRLAEYAVQPHSALRKVDPAVAPLSAYLGVLGMPGLTAYHGLLHVAGVAPGETVCVSGAAGAVGSAVGQIARLKGCRAVGIAGGPEKCAWVGGELGFDAAIDYKAQDVGAALREAAPGGVDVYFDNVGGPVTDAVFPRLNVNSRVAICGQISQYNAVDAPQGPRLLWHFIVKRIRAQGFLVFDFRERHAEALADMAAWVADGSLKYRETVAHGLENAPAAFIGMLGGANIGKQVVKLAEV